MKFEVRHQTVSEYSNLYGFYLKVRVERKDLNLWLFGISKLVPDLSNGTLMVTFSSLDYSWKMLCVDGWVLGTAELTLCPTVVYTFFNFPSIERVLQISLSRRSLSCS